VNSHWAHRITTGVRPSEGSARLSLPPLSATALSSTAPRAEQTQVRQYQRGRNRRSPRRVSAPQTLREHLNEDVPIRIPHAAGAQRAGAAHTSRRPTTHEGRQHAPRMARHVDDRASAPERRRPTPVNPWRPAAFAEPRGHRHTAPCSRITGRAEAFALGRHVGHSRDRRPSVDPTRSHRS
jgi:hypothetical protein